MFINRFICKKLGVFGKVKVFCGEMEYLEVTEARSGLSLESGGNGDSFIVFAPLPVRAVPETNEIYEKRVTGDIHFKVDGKVWPTNT